jgi:hypothetical protein
MARGCCYTRPMRVTQFGRIRLCLSIAVVLLAVFPTATPARDATGHFEMYCDGVGLFLAKVDGAPTPGKPLLFLYTGSPRIPHVPRETWRDVSVYRNGCIADGKCEVFARGKVWLADEATRDAKRISGKYEIELRGQHLNGQFVAEQRNYRQTPRICM